MSSSVEAMSARALLAHLRNVVDRDFRYVASTPVSELQLLLYDEALNACAQSPSEGRRDLHASSTLLFDTAQMYAGPFDPETGQFELGPPISLATAWRQGNAYEWGEGVRAGDTIHTDWRLAEVEQRRTRRGPAIAATVAIAYSDQDGVALGTNRESLIWFVSECGS